MLSNEVTSSIGANLNEYIEVVEYSFFEGMLISSQMTIYPFKDFEVLFHRNMTKLLIDVDFEF